MMFPKNLADQKKSNIGLTPDNPIVVTARNTATGIRKEYEYIDKKFPGYELVRQALLENDGILMDRLVIEKKGKKIQLYFDIKSFFGK